MTLKNSMPIHKTMNKSKKSATNKFSSHTLGSRSPFEPMASAGTMLRDDLNDIDDETSIALSMSMTNKQNNMISPPHIVGNLEGSIGTNFSKTGNGTSKAKTQGRRLHDAIARDVDDAISEREDFEDFSEDEPEDSKHQTPGGRDSLAYSGDAFKETLEGAGGTSVNFGFSATRNSFMLSNARAAEREEEKTSTVGRSGKATTDKSLLNNSDIRQLHDLTSSGVDSSVVNFNITENTLPNNIMAASGQ